MNGTSWDNMWYLTIVLLGIALLTLAYNSSHTSGAPVANTDEKSVVHGVAARVIDALEGYEGIQNTKDVVEMCQELVLERQNLSKRAVDILGRSVIADKRADRPGLITDRGLICIYLLGAMRIDSEFAIESLVRFVDFTPTETVSSIDEFHLNPCAGALVQIGAPARDAIIKGLSGRESIEKLELFWRIIEKVEGGKEVGRSFVRTELSLLDEKDAQWKGVERLLRVSESARR